MGALLQLLQQAFHRPESEEVPEQHIVCGCCSEIHVDMTQVVWIDSRSRTSGSDSKFEIQLRETLHIT